MTYSGTGSTTEVYWRTWFRSDCESMWPPCSFRLSNNALKYNI